MRGVFICCVANITVHKSFPNFFCRRVKQGFNVILTSEKSRQQCKMRELKPALSINSTLFVCDSTQRLPKAYRPFAHTEAESFLKSLFFNSTLRVFTFFKIEL